MSWNKNVQECIIVAGGHGMEESLTHLGTPRGLFVDISDTVYVVDYNNDRVMRWTQGAIQGTIIAGGNGPGKKSNQFSIPEGLAFNGHGNLYVADIHNYRVQQFLLE